MEDDGRVTRRTQKGHGVCVSVSTRISKSPVLVRALPVSERVRTRFSTGIFSHARISSGTVSTRPSANSGHNAPFAKMGLRPSFKLQYGPYVNC